MSSRIQESHLPVSYNAGPNVSDSPVTTVELGESSLQQVARRLKLDPDDLLLANPQIKDRFRLLVGQDIHLPQAQSPAKPTHDAAPVAGAPPVGSAQTLLDDPLAKSIAMLQLQQRGQPAPNVGGKPGQGGPGTVLAWKREEGAGKTSSPVKAGGAQGPAGTVSVGTRLGVNGKGEEVRVKREVGSRQGYDNKWQAMAVARLGRAEPATVILVGKKWHALETTASIDAKFTAADATRVMHTLPSSAGIADAQKLVKALKARLEELKNMKPTKDVEQEKDKVRQELAQADLRRASLILGVPESDIHFKGNPSGKDPGYINIIPNVDSDHGGGHGPAPGQGGEFEFKPGMADAFEINYSMLDKPDSAARVLYHEVEHHNHWELAQQAVKDYQKTGKTFVGGVGLKYFKQWIEDQAATGSPLLSKALSKADADLVVDVAGNFDGMTEARANMRAVLAVFEAGAPDLAAKALAGYAAALTPKPEGLGAYPTPHPKSQFMIGLTEEIRTAYRKMPPDLQRKFVDAIAVAKKKYPSAWVSQLNLSK